MSIETEMVGRLEADAAVAGYVSRRIYAHVAPQGATYPLLLYKFPSTKPQQAAAQRESRNSIRASVVVDVFATDYGDAKALARAVRATLDSWRDQARGIDSFRWIDQTEDAGPEAEGSRDYLFQVTQTYEVCGVEK